MASTGTKEGWRGIVRRGASGTWRIVHTPGVATDPRRFAAALRGTRLETVSHALWVFMIGMSLDDLRLVRFPSYLVGALLAVLVFAFAGPLLARRMARRHRLDDDGDFDVRLALRGRLGQLYLLVTVFAALAWMVVFSTGVPPWA
ncbi:MAG: hypothetical protein ACPGQL_06070 [Thermoplasmatota archaeon]